MNPDAAYVLWLDEAIVLSGQPWGRFCREYSDCPWREWYEAGDTPEQAFGRAQQEQIPARQATA